VPKRALRGLFGGRRMAEAFVCFRVAMRQRRWVSGQALAPDIRPGRRAGESQYLSRPDLRFLTYGAAASILADFHRITFKPHLLRYRLWYRSLPCWRCTQYLMGAEV